MRQFFVVLLFFIHLNGFSQENINKFKVGIGGGLIHYPNSGLSGFTHHYHFDFFFSNHFAAKLSLDFGRGQKNEEYYFDFAKSAILGVGIVYIPIEKFRHFNVNTSFSLHNHTRIVGTKDEIVNSNFALSAFTSFEEATSYGLNIGLQCPIVQKEHFLFAARFDTWLSLLKTEAMSVNFIVAYNF